MVPHVFGQSPEVLGRLVERALAHPEVVPLVGVANARETAQPVTGRGGSTMVFAIPYLLLLKGWHALRQVCGAGVIALLAQGGPPHPGHGLCHLKALAPYRHPAAQKGFRGQQSLSQVEDQLSQTVLGFALTVVGP